MAETSIEWCDYTFNPVEGCQRVSPGCVNCYAERKNKWLHGGENWGPNSPRLKRSEAYWRQPLKWDLAAKDEQDGANVENGHPPARRRKVFCASVADVFEDHPEWVEPRQHLFELIRHTPHLDWLLLTKRPENIMRLWPRHDHALGALPFPGDMPPPGPTHWPNVWLGTTAEDRERLARLDDLRRVPAEVRFVSFEPLLENLGDVNMRGIHWAICGGESGPGARQFDVEWARSLRDQCRNAGVAFFFKQLGARTRMATDGGDPLPMFFKKHQAADLGFMPEDLRIRQFPEVRR
jgi:protein gp37